MNIKQALLKSFNTATFIATVQLVGSSQAYLENITVARNIPTAEMTAGRAVAVLFFDEFRANDAVVAAVW
ncbi:hypothetical protein [Dehalogenimonas etheniformans]|uniref:Uncharacterized protein n=1 Tax=Dehalogenimonas etheniformans TaxID=1536648 RepID=A0A2P5P6U8_9CHLR|nr:hypothetical protein [Dehalogenimonas etheniformans]PPD58022.1 hypothetical protein JP09_006950 [Dehalogenimonas etheniformans]QNT75372.1 hypothetical protein HX448_01035 [Dehalogenimonas etheniformans]